MAIKVYNSCLKDSAHNTLYFESFGGVYFWSNELEVLKAQYQLNRKFCLKKRVSLNDFYRYLGIPEQPIGNKLGWYWYISEFIYQHPWISFIYDVYDSSDDLPSYYHIVMPFPPRDDYKDFKEGDSRES